MSSWTTDPPEEEGWYWIYDAETGVGPLAEELCCHGTEFLYMRMHSDGVLRLHRPLRRSVEAIPEPPPFEEDDR